MEVKTTIPGLKFVGCKLLTSQWLADFFINNLTIFMSKDVDLGRLPLYDIEISDWIGRLKQFDFGGMDFSSWKRLHGIYKLAELANRFSDPSFLPEVYRQTNVIFPPEAIEKIKYNLERSAFDEVNRLFTEAIRKGGSRDAVDVVGLLATVRAMQTVYRCIARYHVSPITLIEQAREGDRTAVLTLIKLDKLFCRDSCTKDVLQKGLLSGDKPFNDQVARAQLFEPTFRRRDACQIYMVVLAGLQTKLPPIFKLRLILDPDGTTFRGSYAFEKCFERVRNDLGLN